MEKEEDIQAKFMLMFSSESVHGLYKLKIQQGSDDSLCQMGEFRIYRKEF